MALLAVIFDREGYAIQLAVVPGSGRTTDSSKTEALKMPLEV